MHFKKANHQGARSSELKIHAAFIGYKLNIYSGRNAPIIHFSVKSTRSFLFRHQAPPLMIIKEHLSPIVIPFVPTVRFNRDEELFSTTQIMHMLRRGIVIVYAHIILCMRTPLKQALQKHNLAVSISTLKPFPCTLSPKSLRCHRIAYSMLRHIVLLTERTSTVT